MSKKKMFVVGKMDQEPLLPMSSEDKGQQAYEKENSIFIREIQLKV